MIQMFSIFTIFTKKKEIVNLYKKELLVCFSACIKMCSSQNVLNCYNSNWLTFNMYVISIGLYTNVNSDILSTLQ